jgi:predicted TIM-barrel fold metal-dependent hydrolase
MRTIALEEHFATPAFMEGPGSGLGGIASRREPRPGMPEGFALLPQRLVDLGDGRIAEMDAAGVDVQVLSLNSPGVEQLEAHDAVDLARDVNDQLAEAVRRYPGRIEGFATLPTSSPDVAAEELRRTVEEYGFKGAAINGHTRGRYLDDEFFWPILEVAETLQVPLYLHPTPPPQAVIDASYTGNFAPGVTALLAASGWGWHIETAVHVLRIVLSGAFDRYPRLQLVIGHLGEALPFMMQRLDNNLSKHVTKLDRSVGEYLRENVHYTFSGFNYTAPFLDLLLEVGTDRIMFSADYPYASMPAAVDFLDRLPLSPADK